MTSDERFERIETDLMVVSQALVQTQSLLRTMAEEQVRLQAIVSSMATSIDRYADAADARMKRIEENLDGLIRAITAEHSNGKGKQ